MVFNKEARTTFNSRAFALFVLICVALGFLISTHSRTLDDIFALLWLSFLLISSLMIVWRLWKHPDELKRCGMSQLTLLPRRWQKWMLGENDKDSPR